MPEWTKLTSARVGEQCYRLRHPSGLSIYVWPKPGYKACYATFAARYGSIDTAFMRQGDAAPTVVPAGIHQFRPYGVSVFLYRPLRGIPGNPARFCPVPLFHRGDGEKGAGDHRAGDPDVRGQS